MLTLLVIIAILTFEGASNLYQKGGTIDLSFLKQLLSIAILDVA